MRREQGYLSAFVLLFLISANGFAQSEANSLLEMRIRGDLVKGKTVRAVLANVASVYHVPIGFEPPAQLVMRTRSDQAKDQLVPRDGTLREVLNEISSIEGSYQWQIIDGSINVYPTRDRDEVIESILQVRISRISVLEPTSAMDVGYSIAEAPEVKNALKSFGLTDIHFYYASESMDRLEKDVKPALTLENSDVRTVLNRVIRSTRMKFWAITRWRDDGEFITITTS